MALNDRLNRNGDGSDLTPVELIDAKLTQLADRWANDWQARTRQSRQSLTFDLYILATVAALIYVFLTHEFLFLGVAVLAYAGSAPGKRRGGLIDEIQLEAAGLPRRTLKYLGVFILGLGLYGLLSSAMMIPIYLLHGDAILPCLPGLVGGLALTALKVADYVARTNPSRPDGDAEKPLRRAWKSRALPMSA